MNEYTNVNDAQAIDFEELSVVELEERLELAVGRCLCRNQDQ
jgi:hypothetical protein